MARFENKRVLLNDQLDHLSDLTAAQVKNPASLNTLVSEMSKTRKSLHILVPKEDLADCILADRMSRLLDRPIREAWETSRVNITEIALLEIVTKRIILSDVSQLYDPIGIISSVKITSKCLLQELWLHKLSWDEPLPNSILKKGCTSEKISPTWILSLYQGDQEESVVELHGFSDASQQAMVPVLYIKSTSLTAG